MKSCCPHPLQPKNRFLGHDRPAESCGHQERLERLTKPLQHHYNSVQCTLPLVACSKPSLKFVKKILCYPFFDHGLVDVSDIFYFLFGSGEGKGESGTTGREGGLFFIENPRRGGGFLGRGGRGRGGREGACREFGGIIGGGGVSIFFRAEMPAKRVLGGEQYQNS